MAGRVSRRLANRTAGHRPCEQCRRIPLRKTAERGYRAGSDPAQQWIGLVPFEAMPHAVNPSRGWLATANNRLAPADYPYPLFGCWASGHRGLRIRQMIEQQIVPTQGGDRFSHDKFRDMQQDAVSLRAITCVPPLLKALSQLSDPQIQSATSHLKNWDGRVEPDLVAPTIFNVFYTFWAKAVADARFPAATAELLSRQAEGIASRLLADDPHGWFASGQRAAAIERAFQQAIVCLTERFGADTSQWQWSKLHRLPLKHVLGNRGDIGELLNHGNVPVKGDMTTVCNTGNDANWLATTGAGYRLIADLSNNVLMAVDGQSQSGNPGTAHYRDQLDDWLNGRYHALPLDRSEASKLAVEKLQLRPA